MLFVKNSKKREQSLVLFTSFTFQRDNVTERCVYENYDDDGSTGRYSDCISIFVGDALIAGVGINLSSNNYSKDLLFKMFVIIFNQKFEDELTKCIAQNKYIVDIANVIKVTKEKWFEFIVSSFDAYGFPRGELQEHVVKCMQSNEG